MNVLLPQQLAAGNGADLYVDWPGIYSTQAVGVLAKNGYALDVSDEPWAKALNGSLKTLSGYDGKVYLPRSVALGFSTTYNQTALDKAGLKIPAKWDEVIPFCKEARGKGLVPYALGAQTGSQTQMPAMTMGAHGDRPRHGLDRAADRRQVQLRHAPAGSRVFEKFQEMNKGGCFVQALGTSEDVAARCLAPGKALGFFWSVQRLQDHSGHDAGQAGLHHLSGTNNPDETLFCVGIGSGLSINAKTKYPEAAKKFMAFLMQPRTPTSMRSPPGRCPPCRTPDFAAADQRTSLIVKAQAEKKTAPLTNQMWPNPRIVPAQRTATQQMLGGSIAPVDVAKAMDQAWDEK